MDLSSFDDLETLNAAQFRPFGTDSCTAVQRNCTPLTCDVKTDEGLG
jgi:hypothetical protein